MPTLAALHQLRKQNDATAAAAAAEAGAELAEEIPLPAEWRRYRRLKVSLGRFGLAETFSFSEHNATPHLCTLDAAAAADGYVNPMLLLLYLLPWSQVRMFGWVGESGKKCKGGMKGV
jgi:hypothetical protein